MEADQTVTDPDSAARDHVREVTRAAGSSFYWGMRILPAARRDAMYAVYAFCRAVDDIADGPGSVAEKRQRLDDWRHAIDALYDGTALRTDDPKQRALAAAIDTYALERAEFLEVIAGMEMDTDGTMRAPPMATLELYCRRVAGAVGLLSIPVFGATGKAAREFALALGTALQFTNILRDLRDDARLGRLYLPAEHLAAHGIHSDAPDTVLSHPALADVCRRLADDARRYYRDADAILERCDRRALRPAIVMKESYRRILEKLVAAGWRDLDHDPGISTARKMWITLRHGMV